VVAEQRDALAGQDHVTVADSEDGAQQPLERLGSLSTNADRRSPASATVRDLG
jgi:hypothetical protein